LTLAARDVLGASALVARVGIGARAAVLARVGAARGLHSEGSLAVDTTVASSARAGLAGHVVKNVRNASSTVQARVGSTIAGSQSDFTVSTTIATSAVAIVVRR